MTEIVDGVEGTWTRRQELIVKDGERYRFGGTWHGYDEDLDLRRAFNPEVVVLDDEDYLEVFVPSVDRTALPIADGVYADYDGDLWRLFDDTWTFIGDNTGIDDVYNYTPLRLVAPLSGNFENQEY